MDSTLGVAGLGVFRRRWRSLAAVLLASFALVGAASGSPLSYVRETFTGDYVPIMVEGGATPILVAADDSVRSIPLPFPFTYAGNLYTTANYLAISANGFVFPSRTSVTSSLTTQGNNVNLYVSTFPNSTIAPWYDNLRVAGGGKVLYQTLGAPGSRQLTVQWTDASSFSSLTGGPPRQIHFQVVLFEGTNVIEFRYGPVFGSGYSTLESASIGLEDSLGGSGAYLDAVTGSRVTNYGMMTTNKWPQRHFRFTLGTVSPLAAGTYEVGVGRTYPSLSEAVADLNHRGISGPVTLQLTDAVYDSSAEGGGNVFPILLSLVEGSSASNPITIEPTSGMATLRHRGTESGLCGNQAILTAIDSNNEPILGLVGSDHVRLRRLALEGGPTVDRGLLLIAGSQTDGAQDNTVEDVRVRLDRQNPTSIGIQQFLPVGPTSDTGTNSRNRYYNLDVGNVYAGVSLAGNAIRPDVACEIGVANGGATTIGDVTPGDIGGGGTQTFGIRATNQREVRIFGVEVRNLSGTGTGTVDGIFLDNFPFSVASNGVCEISGNRVHDLDNPSSNAGRMSGIRASVTKNKTSVARIFNNFVYRLDTGSTSTAGRRLVGVLLQDQGGGDSARHEVDFNSVRVAARPLSSTNACLEIGTVDGPVFRVRNNVLANFTGTQTGTGKHYCWVTPGSGTGLSGSQSDYNVLHVGNPANGFIGRTAGVDHATLEQWRSGTATDSNSLAANPHFISQADLHIDPTRPTPVEARGSTFAGTIGWVTTDIDDEPRDPTTPDIGADEGTFLQQQTHDVAATALVDPVAGGVKFAGAFTPRAAFENAGTDPQTDVPVRFRILGPQPATTVVYDQTTVIPSLLSGRNVVASFPSAMPTVPGFYTIEARAELVEDDVPANDVLTGTFELAGQLGGDYRIGAAEPFPFNSLTNAVARLNTVGVADAVTFVLVDPAYGATETFPIQIDAIAGGGASRTLTIRPDVDRSVEITGAHSKALLVFNGADHVILEGSGREGGSRDLTLRNTSGGLASAVIWGQTTQAGDPMTAVTVRNVRAIGSGSEQTLFGIGFGGPTIGLISSGNRNHGNRVEGCEVIRTQYGVYSAGQNAGNKNQGTVIARNRIGAAAPDHLGRGGILLRFENGPEVTENRIESIATSAPASAFGIALGMRILSSETFVGDEVTNAAVTRNVIARVSSSHPDGFSAAGISVAPAGSGATMIVNNMISGVTSQARDPELTVGILLGGGAGSTTRLYFNSVALTGPRGFATASSFALAVGGTNPTVDVRNNILLNQQTSTSAGDSYAIGLDYGAPYSQLTSDRNDLYTTGGTGNVLAVIGGLQNIPDGELVNLAQWRTATGKDANSISADPLFVGGSDLHLRQATTPVVGIGVPIAGITIDIDGETGNRTTMPTLGADEFRAYSLTVAVVGVGSVAIAPDQSSYLFGDLVQLTPTPSAGYRFAGWSGDASGTATPLVLTMNADKAVVATFERIPVAIPLLTPPWMVVLGGGLVGAGARSHARRTSRSRRSVGDRNPQVAR